MKDDTGGPPAHSRRASLFAGERVPLIFMPARGLYVDFRTDFPLNPAVEGLVLRNTVSDQNKNMAIDRAALIISYISN